MRKCDLLLSAALVASALASGAKGQSDRSILPASPGPFDGQIAPHTADSKPATPSSVRAPVGAPNIFLFMSDDAGFAMSSAFGGPISTPNMERLAAHGQRYNRFHTTGICSPSRASLLTGRNHHNAGVGYLSDLPTGFPGYGGKILPETASIAQVLRLNGYSTAMFGKHHNVPTNERSEAGPFDAWPTGLGFEYFFGFVSGDSDQYQPNLYRGVHRVGAGEAKGRMLDRWLADDAIRWVHNQKAGAPDKPFFVYMSPGTPHAPQQAPAEVIARFRGKFDAGWDIVRAETFKRQLSAGIIPKGTLLTPRPEGIPAWNTLSPEQKAFAARSMEVAAAMIAYQDEQLGRVLDELERMGELNRTLVAVVQGDNGASGEAGPGGSINELRGMGVHDEDPAWLAENTDRLGGPATYGNYPVGWAWAMNTPLRWTKQFASMLGGVRNGLILSAPSGVAKPGSICGQFSHLNDIAPTILDAAKLPVPQSVFGVVQKPMDGQSLLPSLSQCDAAKPRTQYFEIGGKIGLYHNNWFLSGDDGRAAWENMPPEGERPNIHWTLYNLEKDFSQSTDLSAKEPQRLKDMITLFDAEARRNNVYPLDHRFAAARGGQRGGASNAPVRKVWDFWGKDVSIPANSDPIMFARSFTLEADVDLQSGDAAGVVVALGSRFGGWSLYLDKGRPRFVFARSTDPKEIWTATSDIAVPQGKTKLMLRFSSLGRGKGADVTISNGTSELAHISLPVNYLMPAGGGETFDIGRDIGVPVTVYHSDQGLIEGDIPHVRVTFD